MNKKRNIIIGLIVCVLLMTVVFFVFNHGKSNDEIMVETAAFKIATKQYRHR